MKFLAFAALVGGPICAYNGFSDKRTHEKLEAEGVNVEGILTGGESSKGRRSGTTYKLDVVYVTQDKRPFKKTLTVPEEFVKTHVSGNTITSEQVEVRYLPSDPATCELVGAKSDHEAKLYGGAAVGLAGLVATGMMFRKR